MLATFQFHPDHTIPSAPWVWVFGSDLAGRSSKGTARIARQSFGALAGVGQGPTGQAYAIATRDAALKVLPLASIALQVNAFIAYARAHPDMDFFITGIDAGLAELGHHQVAPLFAQVPGNCSLPQRWRALLVQAFPQKP